MVHVGHLATAALSVLLYSASTSNANPLAAMQQLHEIKLPIAAVFLLKCLHCEGNLLLTSTAVTFGYVGQVAQNRWQRLQQLWCQHCSLYLCYCTY